MPDPTLEIKNLRFKYPTSEGWIVNVGQFTLAPGEHVLLTGGSGRGKSTLLHLIAGLIEPTRDCGIHLKPPTRPAPLGHKHVFYDGATTIQVAGRNMVTLRGAARDLHRGRSIGMIFQTFNLLHGFSACENVMAAMMFSKIPKAEHAPRAKALLTRLGIDRPNARPEQLSVGQQQRVAVARAVACDPPLVLADEPTASLDPENSGVAMDLIQAVCREKNAALLCVSHDPAMRERFERRLSLEELRA